MKKLNLTDCNVTEAMEIMEGLNELSEKNKNCLRLLTEEMFSMCKELLTVEEMDFQIELLPNECVLSTMTNTQIDDTTKKQLLSVSSDGKNAANKGIKGFFGSVMEALFYDSDPGSYSPIMVYGMVSPHEENLYYWSLAQYMENAPKEEIKKEWDGMEKAIIVNFADDVKVAIRNGKLELSVTKKL